MRELNVNEIEQVNGGGIVSDIIDELVDLADAISGFIDGIQGDRSGDPDPSTK